MNLQTADHTVEFMAGDHEERLGLVEHLLKLPDRFEPKVFLAALLSHFRAGGMT